MASGDTLAVFFPAMSEPPSSNYATFDTRNGVLVLDLRERRLPRLHAATLRWWWNNCNSGLGSNVCHLWYNLS
jgi:hypothetical protein